MKEPRSRPCRVARASVAALLRSSWRAVTHSRHDWKAVAVVRWHRRPTAAASTPRLRWLSETATAHCPHAAAMLRQADRLQRTVRSGALMCARDSPNTDQQGGSQVPGSREQLLTRALLPLAGRVLDAHRLQKATACSLLWVCCTARCHRRKHFACCKSTSLYRFCACRRLSVQLSQAVKATIRCRAYTSCPHMIRCSWPSKMDTG